MQHDFYKSLDRPIDVFGMKGKWIRNFFVLAGVSLFLAFLVGSATNLGFGILIFFVFVIVSFVICLLAQSKISSRRMDRQLFGKDCTRVVTRRETLSRIIFDDPRYDEYKRLLEKSSKV